MDYTVKNVQVEVETTPVHKNNMFSYIKGLYSLKENKENNCADNSSGKGDGINA